jgi:hypothetical protein
MVSRKRRKRYIFAEEEPAKKAAVSFSLIAGKKCQRLPYWTK